MEEQTSQNEMISDNGKFNDRFFRLRQQNKYTDCSFKIENRVINCHKLILCASSPVFEANFFGSFSHDMTNSILITDISYETFELFMEFIYTGELKLKQNAEIDCLVSITYCAQKYLIEDLRKLCVNKLRELINKDNIFEFLAKSFECHLEDFLVSCLYYFVDFIEAGASFCNAILNDESKHFMTSQCFEFLSKNLLDYFGERDDILCFIKAWTIKACHLDNISVCAESLSVKTKLLNLDSALCMKIIQLSAGFFDVAANERKPKSFHRVYYKPVKPLIIDKDQLTFDVNISFKRFISIKSLTINSRLIPSEHFSDICDVNNQSYTENLDIEIIEKCSSKSIYTQHHTIENVGFNNSFKVKFNDRLILFPYHAYVIKIKWNDTAICYEYPRAIFSLMEKGNDGKVDAAGGNPLSVVQFHEYNYCYNLPFGSIVQGIYYDIIS